MHEAGIIRDQRGALPDQRRRVSQAERPDMPADMRRPGVRLAEIGGGVVLVGRCPYHHDMAEPASQFGEAVPAFPRPVKLAPCVQRDGARRQGKVAP
jgi:hypothetical protein